MQNHPSAARCWLRYLLLAALLALLFAVNLCSGSVRLSPSQVLGLLLGQEQNPTAWRILWEIRLPRCLAAVVLGGALSVSGFLLQTFFANPIAGPTFWASPPAQSSPSPSP